MVDIERCDICWQVRLRARAPVATLVAPVARQGVAPPAPHMPPSSTWQELLGDSRGLRLHAGGGAVAHQAANSSVRICLAACRADADAAPRRDSWQVQASSRPTMGVV